jgi:hypothetical protein
MDILSAYASIQMGKGAMAGMSKQVFLMGKNVSSPPLSSIQEGLAHPYQSTAL